MRKIKRFTKEEKVAIRFYKEQSFTIREICEIMDRPYNSIYAEYVKLDKHGICTTKKESLLERIETLEIKIEAVLETLKELLDENK